jgi:hypothetical protein
VLVQSWTHRNTSRESGCDSLPAAAARRLCLRDSLCHVAWSDISRSTRSPPSAQAAGASQPIHPSPRAHGRNEVTPLLHERSIDCGLVIVALLFECRFLQGMLLLGGVASSVDGPVVSTVLCRVRALAVGLVSAAQATVAACCPPKPQHLGAHQPSIMAGSVRQGVRRCLAGIRRWNQNANMFFHEGIAEVSHRQPGHTHICRVGTMHRDYQRLVSDRPRIRSQRSTATMKTGTTAAAAAAVWSPLLRPLRHRLLRAEHLMASLLEATHAASVI